jgi:hypothetical protein
MQRELVDFMDARRTLVRHADLDIGLAQRAADGTAGAAAAGARRRRRPETALPSSATTVMSRSCAAITAASTAADWPLALSASSTSPAWPSARTWRAKRSASMALALSAFGVGGVAGQRDGAELGPLAFEAADELRGELGRQQPRHAGAAGQHLAAAGHAGQDRLHRLRDGFAEDRSGLVFEVGTVDEVLLNPLLEHEAG